jgi:hypothetical protein
LEHGSNMKEYSEYIEPTIDYLVGSEHKVITKEFLTRVFQSYRADIINNCISIASEGGVDELYEYLNRQVK